jgi:hypothetical protein
VALDRIGLLLETYNGNKHIPVTIDHYSKWWKAKVMVDHDVENIAKFLEDKIICRFGVWKSILINNGSEWTP